MRTSEGTPRPTSRGDAGEVHRRRRALAQTGPHQESWVPRDELPCYHPRMNRQPEIDRWFEGYENPMKDVVQRVREIILAADPRIDECVKWQTPTFTYKGNLAS